MSARAAAALACTSPASSGFGFRTFGFLGLLVVFLALVDFFLGGGDALSDFGAGPIVVLFGFLVALLLLAILDY
jgi:hypothetical protein